MTLKQLHLQLRFQSLYDSAERGLRQMQGFCRATEAAGLDNREKRLELPGVESHA
jgi:hypothetical protein